MDSAFWPKSYGLTVIYSVDDTAYVGETNMVRDGEIYTSEDSSDYMCMTSTVLPVFTYQSQTYEIV